MYGCALFTGTAISPRRVHPVSFRRLDDEKIDPMHVSRTRVPLDPTPLVFPENVTVANRSQGSHPKSLSNVKSLEQEQAGARTHSLLSMFCETNSRSSGSYGTGLGISLFSNHRFEYHQTSKLALLPTFESRIHAIRWVTQCWRSRHSPILHNQVHILSTGSGPVLEPHSHYGAVPD